MEDPLSCFGPNTTRCVKMTGCKTYPHCVIFKHNAAHLTCHRVLHYRLAHALLFTQSHAEPPHFTTVHGDMTLHRANISRIRPHLSPNPISTTFLTNFHCLTDVNVKVCFSTYSPFTPAAATPHLHHQTSHAHSGVEYLNI